MQKRQVPGLALLIIRHGNIVKAQGYGFSNVELQFPSNPKPSSSRAQSANSSRQPPS